MQLCANGLACFMIGINTLTIAVFYGDWLWRHASIKLDPCNDPALASAFCELREPRPVLSRRDADDFATAIEVARTTR